MQRLRALSGLIRIALLLSLCAMTAQVAPARAVEQILSYDADIQVMEDASLEVTETITVRAERRQIRRGIYRDFPTVYHEPSGMRRTAGFDVLEIRRDGNEEPWHTESIQGGVRVYIGDADVMLPSGEYTYTIRYRTTRQLRYFDDYDELYWNVTGNFWSFPIREASATVRLPEGARILQHAAYTGRFGATGSDARVTSQGDGRISFETTRPLGVGEGLTVAVAFPKGVVEQPGPTAVFIRQLLDNWGLLVLAFGAPAVLLYFFWIWGRVGKDPPSGTVIPLFHPPEELTPAGVSFLFYRGFKNKRGVSKAFLAALVALAVGRHITIRDEDSDIALERGPNAGGDIDGPGERRIYDRLLGSRDSIEMNKANGKTVASAISGFSSAIERAFGNGRYFTRNTGWFVLGAVLSAVTLVGFLVGGGIENVSGAFVIPVTIGGVLGALLLSAGIRRFRGSVPGGSYIVGALAIAGGLIITVPVVLALFLFEGLYAFAPAAAFLLAVVNVAFFHLLPAPTVQGRRLMDEVEGFRMYLETAESERMNLIGAPELSVELFERFLPHAVGLGVEEPWSEAYEAHLARTLPAGDQGYHPVWYHGSRWDSGHIARSTGTISSAVASGMASAVPSSSSSGSGGGGFSGGGGGGGGGGGW